MSEAEIFKAGIRLMWPFNPFRARYRQDVLNRCASDLWHLRYEINYAIERLVSSPDENDHWRPRIKRLASEITRTARFRDELLEANRRKTVRRGVQGCRPSHTESPAAGDGRTPEDRVERLM